MKKKITIDDLAGMVKLGFDEMADWQKWATKWFESIDHNLKSIDHKLDKVVYRPEFEKLENRVRELEDLLAVIRKG